MKIKDINKPFPKTKDPFQNLENPPPGRGMFLLNIT
jgi:hypothetical protein